MTPLPQDQYADVKKLPEMPSFRKGNYKIHWLAVAVLMFPLLSSLGAVLCGVPLQWNTFLVGVLMTVFNGMIGVTVGYHRLFSHRAFKASEPLQWLCAFAGAGAFEGSAKWWCRNHRIHHRYVDTDKDPYNAKRGFCFSHMGWMIMQQEYSLLGKVDVSDFRHHRVIQAQHKHYLKLAMLSGVILPTLICGFGWGDWLGGYFYAGLFKVAFVHHCTFFINSLAHTSLFGAVQQYSDRHTSHDSMVCALLTFGEGYHNYHHEFADDYRNGIRWYHYDPTKWFIRACSVLGFAWDLVRTPNDVIEMNMKRLQRKLAEERIREIESAALKPNPQPTWTWDDVQTEVNKGRKLVVIHDDVYDLDRGVPTGSGYTHGSKNMKWYECHPGGQRILDTFIGKDATAAFTGDVYEHHAAAESYLPHLRVKQEARSFASFAREEHTLVVRATNHELFLVEPLFLEDETNFGDEKSKKKLRGYSYRGGSCSALFPFGYPSCFFSFFFAFLLYFVLLLCFICASILFQFRAAQHFYFFFWLLLLFVFFFSVLHEALASLPLADGLTHAHTTAIKNGEQLARRNYRYRREHHIEAVYTRPLKQSKDSGRCLVEMDFICCQTSPRTTPKHIQKKSGKNLHSSYIFLKLFSFFLFLSPLVVVCAACGVETTLRCLCYSCPTATIRLMDENYYWLLSHFRCGILSSSSISLENNNNNNNNNNNKEKSKHFIIGALLRWNSAGKRYYTTRNLLGFLLYLCVRPVRISVTCHTSASTPRCLSRKTVARGCSPATTYRKNEIEQTLPQDIEELHAAAVEHGEETYIDPNTGLTVFTRIAHLKKKKCCGNYCRHCPYNHCNVANRSRCNGAEEASKNTQKPEPEKPSTPAAGDTPKPAHSAVYTKGGDKGTSSLFTGERRPKTDAVFEALGATDELSSHVGLVRSFIKSDEKQTEKFQRLLGFLEGIQQELLNIGTVIATPAAGKDAESSQLIKLIETYKFPEKTAEMEKYIDEMDSQLKPLRVFILPGGGTMASAQLHVCRTACRRAERRMIEVRELYGEQYTDHLRQATVFVNRLSDFFFIAGRFVAEEDIVRQYD
eukprot:gene3893-2762_t